MSEANSQKSVPNGIGNSGSTYLHFPGPGGLFEGCLTRIRRRGEPLSGEVGVSGSCLLVYIYGHTR